MSTEVGRIAFRVEGDQWKAYYALPDTMEGALLLGQIPFSMARHPEIKSGFMSLMQKIVDIIFDADGHIHTWAEPHKAPEHERSGRA